jgi:MFS family permease
VQQPTEDARIPADVKLLLAALGFGAIGFSVLATVIGLQVFELTGRERDLGLVGLSQFLPILILSPFTGTIADRFDRRWVYGAGLTIMIVSTAGLLLYAATDPTSVLPIFLLLGLNGIGRAVGWPASRSLPIDLAPEGSLERIVAIRSLVFQVALIIGPLIGAFANRTSNVLPYATIIGSQLVALVLLPRVGKPSTAKLDSVAGPAQAIRDAVAGLRFIRQSQIILGAISLDLFAVLFGGAVALLPAIVEKRLDISDVDLGVGVLRASIAAAAAATAFVLSVRPLKRKAGRWLFAVIGVFGLATIVLGLTRNYAVAIAAVATLSAADQISVFIRSSVVPLATPESMRGRVLAVENVFIGGSNELGAWESGETAAWFGLGPAVVIGGIGTLVVVAAGWVLFPDLRNVDRFVDVKPAPQ